MIFLVFCWDYIFRSHVTKICSERCCYIMVDSAMPASENIARTEQCISPPVCHIRTVFHNLTMKKEEGNKTF